jgi:hypothetical protein
MSAYVGISTLLKNRRSFFDCSSFFNILAETPAAPSYAQVCRPNRDSIQGVVVVVVVVSEGPAELSLQLVVVCFSTTPGWGAVTVFLCTTAPLSQVVVVLWLVAGVWVITVEGGLT